MYNNVIKWRGHDNVIDKKNERGEKEWKSGGNGKSGSESGDP